MSPRNIILTAGTLLLAAFVTPAAAEFDAADYHQETCTRCHDGSVYTRDNRRVNSYPELKAQVARCDANLGTGLFPEDLQLLVEHLNDKYYQFAN
jgi:hypothetical protein